MYSDRLGNIKESDSKQDRLLRKMYTTMAGRFVISLLVKPSVSKIGGRLLSTRISTLAIPAFCKENHIDLSMYEQKKFTSYNDFFIRKIKAGLRPIDREETHAISPCDSKLSIYPISQNAIFDIKHTKYTVYELLKDKKLAQRYEGGYLCVFRLTVDDYHRYCYIDDGVQSGNRRIDGVLHTVNPVANDVYPIYKENSREYSVLQSLHFGRVLMMEVGALMVGKIVNYKERCSVLRGEEKGRFEFGGSTVILMFEKDKMVPDEDILKNTARDCETCVKMGEKFAVSAAELD
jgi:phosphatidylserine decarboxylase